VARSSIFVEVWNLCKAMTRQILFEIGPGLKEAAPGLPLAGGS